MLKVSVLLLLSLLYALTHRSRHSDQCKCNKYQMDQNKSQFMCECAEGKTDANKKIQSSLSTVCLTSTLSLSETIKYNYPVNAIICTYYIFHTASIFAKHVHPLSTLLGAPAHSF